MEILEGKGLKMENPILDQFAMLNKCIAESIRQKDYVRVAALDQARRDILKDLCLIDANEMDNSFFKYVEKCASQNAELIAMVESDLNQLSSETGKLAKARRAYIV